MVNNEKYVLDSNYDFGLVCYIDILGFKDIANDIKNFEKIKNIFNFILMIASTEKLNSELIKQKQHCILTQF